MFPNFPIEQVLGPLSGLIISLVFATTFYKLFKETFTKMLERTESTTQQIADSTKLLVEALKLDVADCNNRYQQVLNELLRLKDQNK